MNNVGARGKGESVWLGFFLYDVLTRFSDVARLRGDTDFSDHCRVEAEQLRKNIEQHAWDGAWYRRAYFDDGTPLGSATNPECQIDSIAQSWSVLSGAGDAQRRQAAMDSLDRRLVQRDHALVKLLDPPFDHSALDPGYIKGYLPGVRENGGQYTHAAIWAATAFFAMGDAERGWELLKIINPVNRSTSTESADIYKVEPYVVSADVYAVAPHTGRGGWTWYTGSAGWLYRLIVESMLGVTLEADKLRLDPRLPSAWTGCKIVYRYRETFYDIAVSRVAESGPTRVRVDGVEQLDRLITMVDDRGRHQVEVDIPAATVSRDLH
jgi:cellobiose phosphorylase